MLLLAVTLSAIGLICGAWYLFENHWNKRLFGRRGGTDFVLNVRARKAATLLREQRLLPIDVRPSRDYLAGHLPGAINVSFTGATPDTDALATIDRNHPVLVYCDGGYRSRRSLSSLRAAGFTSIYHLHRGLISWKLANEPTESGPTP